MQCLEQCKYDGFLLDSFNLDYQFAVHVLLLYFLKCRQFILCMFFTMTTYQCI